MGYSKEEVQQITQRTRNGENRISETLDASNAEEIITLADVTEKVTFQGTGDLAGNLEFSLDGENFSNTTAIAASNALVTFNTHMIKAIKITRSSGSGKVIIAAK